MEFSIIFQIFQNGPPAEKNVLFFCTSRLPEDSHFLILANVDPGDVNGNFSWLPFQVGIREAEAILCGADGAAEADLVESTDPLLEPPVEAVEAVIDNDLDCKDGGDDISLRNGGLEILGLGGTGGGLLMEAGEDRSLLEPPTGVDLPEFRLVMLPSRLGVGIRLLNGLGDMKLIAAEPADPEAVVAGSEATLKEEPSLRNSLLAASNPTEVRESCKIPCTPLEFSSIFFNVPYYYNRTSSLHHFIWETEDQQNILVVCARLRDAFAHVAVLSVQRRGAFF